MDRVDVQSVSIDDATWKCCSGWGWSGEILIRVALASIYGASYFFNEPFIRHVEVHDWPLYNYPHRDPESVAAWVVAFGMVVLPVIAVSIVSLVGRFSPLGFWTRKYEHTHTTKMLNRRALSEWILAMLAISMGYLCNGVITDVIKNAYGRPRPDFLSRCFAPNASYTEEFFWITLPTSDPLRLVANSPNQMRTIELYHNLTGGAPAMKDYNNPNNVDFPFIEEVPSIVPWENCINADQKLVVDEGRRSFPSGHTSASFSGATFMALYSFYWFGKIDSNMNLGMRKRHLHFPGTSLRIGVLFLWYVPAFYVGISRTQDYRHHGTDIIAGAIIGTFSVLFTFVQYYNIFKSNRNDRERL